jgi:LPS-assembly lipoprotein
MSLFDRRTFLMFPLALAACGFTPVYAPGGVGAALRNRVLVDPPTDRDTFLLVQDLEQRLGRGTAAQYGLAVILALEIEGLAVTAAGDITRYNMVGKADYALRDLRDGAIISSGQVDNFTGYSSTGSTVETLAAERDARARLMTILADQITARLYALTDLPPS